MRGLSRHGGLHGAGGAAEGRDGDAGGRLQLRHAHDGALDGADRLQRRQLPPGRRPLHLILRNILHAHMRMEVRSGCSSS